MTTNLSQHPAIKTETIETGLNILHLKAAAIAMSREDARPYLNGVALHFTDNNLFMIGCDGHRLIRIKTNTLIPEDKQHLFEKPVILPAAFVKQVIKWKRKKADPEFFDFSYCTDGVITAGYDDQDTIIAASAPYNYPDYQRTIPNLYNWESDAIAHIGVNGHYVGDFAKALDIINHNKTSTVIMNFTGSKDAPILITAGSMPEFTGVLMPMRVY